jgi:hypothetical protein
MMNCTNDHSALGPPPTPAPPILMLIFFVYFKHLVSERYIPMSLCKQIVSELHFEQLKLAILHFPSVPHDKILFTFCQQNPVPEFQYSVSLVCRSLRTKLTF